MNPPLKFTIGSVEVTAPANWAEVGRAGDRLILRTPDGREQTTVSIMHFGAVASFDDFQLLCQRRLDAERTGTPDSSFQAQGPFDIEGKFGMFYSGGDKKSGRVFSGYLSLWGRELIAIYVEGIGIEPAAHLETFKAFAGGLSWK